MPRGPFDPRFADLPAEIPVFPLAGALLLPGGQLPLNVFEPRYLALVDDALREGRMFGLIQPRDPTDDGVDAALYPVGCLGRISAFTETPDGRYQVTLTGVTRFRSRGETAGGHGYRRLTVDYGEHADDLDARDGDALDRDRLLAVIEPYLREQEMELDPDAVRRTPDEVLLTSLAMICPLAPREKQALLEAPPGAERAETMIALLEMASHDPDAGSAAPFQ